MNKESFVQKQMPNVSPAQLRNIIRLAEIALAKKEKS